MRGDQFHCDDSSELMEKENLELDTIRQEYDDCLKTLDAIAFKVEVKKKLLGERLQELDEMDKKILDRKEKVASALPERIRFNVGGKKFATTKSTLLKHDTFFSAFLSSDVKPDEKGTFLFDCDFSL